MIVHDLDAYVDRLNGRVQLAVEEDRHPRYNKIMIETYTVPKSLYDLAKAIGRWESEGGAKESPIGSELGQDIALQAFEERILRCLGAAVILQWNDLPTVIQRSLFDDAASMSDPERRFRLKQQIARFLHEHKNDT
jgi:hypothetical protein